MCDITRKIKLYWWNESPNFGDEASAYLVNKMFGHVTWAQPQLSFSREIKRFFRAIKAQRKYKFPLLKGYLFPWQKGFFSIGSILDFSSYKTIVWGSGFREYDSVFRGGKVYAVRGYLSLDKVPLKNRIGDVAIGDPALLLPLVYTPKCKKKYRVSIVPHFSEYEYFNRMYSKEYNVVDVRTVNVESVIDSIVSSDYVLSSSLHGLIIAHAYGVPAIWVKHGWIHSSEFKFEDYFSSLDIQMYKPFTEEALFEKNVDIEKFFKENSAISLPSNINDLRCNLLKNTPFK